MGIQTGASAEGERWAVASNLIIKINRWNKMVHGHGIIHCSCVNALYPVQTNQWDKCNLTRFSRNFRFDDFSWILSRASENAVAGHMRPAGLWLDHNDIVNYSVVRTAPTTRNQNKSIFMLMSWYIRPALLKYRWAAVFCQYVNTFNCLSELTLFQVLWSKKSRQCTFVIRAALSYFETSNFSQVLKIIGIYFGFLEAKEKINAKRLLFSVWQRFDICSCCWVVF